MTEDEAKTKWCHAAVASHTDPRQIINGHWLHHCIGSACMAWRKEPFPTAETAKIIKHRRDECGDTMPEAIRHAKSAENAFTNGYCGLAGAPQ